MIRDNRLAKVMLSPKQRWCNMCQCPVDAHKFDAHAKSNNHRPAVHKFRNLKTLADSMWADHRKAPLSEESGRMPGIQREIASQERQRLKALRNRR